MSKTTEIAEKKTTTEHGERGPTLAGCDIFVKCLEREGVETIFAYPGGASMEFHQALTRSKQIRVVLPRHEQGGAFAAGGYARASGKVGVCMATSGPGATNLVTGIADAYMDSVPMVAVTGQVPQAMIGKGAFQETDIFGMTLPVVKHSYLVTDINDIPRIVKEAFYIARSGRPGPVLIDVPKNVQQAKAQPVFLKEITLRGYQPDKRADDVVLNEIIGLIEKAERPVLYCGGGIITGEASAELREFVALTQIPVTTTLMGCGAFPETHPLSLRWLGMHGAAFANWAVSGEQVKEGDKLVTLAPGADLLLAFGVRFDDRVTGKVDKFCEQGTIVHIDIDDSEINKNRRVQLPIVSDIKYALGRLNEMLRQRALQKRFTAWHAQIEQWKKKAPFTYCVTDEVLKSQHMRDHLGGQASEVILPQMVIEMLWELTHGEAIVTTGVGQHQMWAAQYYQVQVPAPTPDQRGLGLDGLRLSGGARRQSGVSRQTGH